MHQRRAGIDPIPRVINQRFDLLRRLGATLRQRPNLACDHGKSASLLARTRRFLDQHDVVLYSEHLSYCAAGGHLYDLLPIPFTEEAVAHVAGRIRTVQDVLGRRIAIENVSYYATPFQALAEVDFVNAVLADADCDLLLDVNNLFVNAINHGYDARDFLARMPSACVVS